MQTRASPFCVQHLLSAAQSLLFVLTVMYDHTHRVRLRLERHTAAAANSVPDVAAVLVFLDKKLLFAAYLRQENIRMVALGQVSSQNTLRWG